MLDLIQSSTSWTPLHNRFFWMSRIEFILQLASIKLKRENDNKNFKHIQ